MGVTQVCERIWLVTFMRYDLGYFDDETCQLESIENPFGPKVLGFPRDAAPCEDRRLMVFLVGRDTCTNRETGPCPPTESPGVFDARLSLPIRGSYIYVTTRDDSARGRSCTAGSRLGGGVRRPRSVRTAGRGSIGSDRREGSLLPRAPSRRLVKWSWSRARRFQSTSEAGRIGSR